MTMIEVPDLSNDTTSAPIPPGMYNARIIGVEKKAAGPTAKNPGAPYLNWKLEITGRDKFSNRVFFYMTSLIAERIGGFHRLWEAATGEKATSKVDTETLMGRQVSVQLAVGTRPDGTTSDFPEVKRVAPMDPRLATGTAPF